MKFRNLARALGSVRALKRLLSVSLMTIALGTSFAAYAQVLPPDAQTTCTVTTGEFASWFAAPHVVTLNGAVDPANSITFTNAIDNCIFYKWSEQMYMWLTSPAPALYGGGDHIFNSPVFYDVSPPDAGGQRVLIPHVVKIPRFFPLRIAQVGPHKLPVVVDKRGNMLEVLRPPVAPSGNPLIRNTQGKLVEIQRVAIGRDGKASFLDKLGKPVLQQRTVTSDLLPKSILAPRMLPMLKKGVQPRMENIQEAAVRSNLIVARLNKTPALAQVLIFNKKPIFVNFFTGAVEPVEQEQAFGQVLLTHAGSLVYFATMVNDVYAYYLTGRHAGVIPPALPAPGNPDTGKFPVSQATLDQVTAFAGKSFVDGIALAIEVKTAWVEASSLPDPQNYIQTSAKVPVYNTANPNLWIPTGATKTIKVALLGIHVVGSANGHSEMIWATFEQKNNSPRMAFQYNATAGPNPHTVNSNVVGNWVLTANGSLGPYNVAHADYNLAPDIEGANGFTISPSDTILRKAFGGGFNQKPNPLIGSTAESNTQVISINNSVQGMMAAAGAGADVRNNYIMTGATWTAGGAAPSGAFPGGNEVGTSRLENTTMETYQQGADNNANGFNCFTCHTSNTTDVSHIFSDLQPLP